MEKIKSIIKAIVASPKVRLALKGLLLAIAAVVAVELGVNVDITGLIN